MTLKSKLEVQKLYHFIHITDADSKKNNRIQQIFPVCLIILINDGLCGRQEPADTKTNKCKCDIIPVIGDKCCKISHIQTADMEQSPDYLLGLP